MATIIRTSGKIGTDRGSAFNFDDMAVQASQYLDEIRHQAEKIIAQATSDADQIRVRAEADGKAAANQNAERVLEARIAETMLPAITATTKELSAAQQAWISEWEKQLIRLASAIAEKVIRREITQRPEITLDLIQDSLKLASGSPRLKIRLNPGDYDALGDRVSQLVEHIGSVGSSEIVRDERISPGGCRVDSDFGTIDQQI
jgi:flagellar assembly protein FliH